MSSLYKRLPAPPRRYRFVLTPLADAMFQLLIFFMLASSLTPYSIVTLRSGPEAVADQGTQGEGGAEPAAAASAVPPETVLWTIDVKAVIVGGQIFDPEDLPDLAAALGSEAVPADVVLIIRDRARVQDIATAMEALADANVASVQIAPDASS
jgi:biopolymer transport protein ExbD